MEYNEEEREESFSLEEYWKLFLDHWYWFAGTILVSICIAVFYLLTTTPIYTRSMMLLIKNDEKGGAANSMISDFQNLGIINNNSNINNDILTISAPIMMEEVVKRLKLDFQMEIKDGLRIRPLYNDAPITIKSGKMSGNQSFSFKVRMLSRGEAELSEFILLDEEISNAPIVAPVGKDIQTPVGKIKISSTPSWDDSFIGKTISVNKYPYELIGKIYAARLNVALSDKEATILNLSLSDEVPERANDILLALVDVFNEQWIEDKNRIAESTYKFITERLESLSKELGNVDQNISDYKSRNLLPDIQAASAMYMQQSNKNYDNLLNLHNQLSMAKYIRDYLNDKTKQNQLLPSSTGIPSSGIEQLIASYNSLMLQRNELVANSNENNPLVAEMKSSLTSQKTAIIRSLENLIAQIQAQIANVQRSEQETNRQIASNPQQAKQLLSVERQQKVKEALYIYLLQKREENELSKTYTAWNTRIIQPPIGNPLPTSPRKKMVLLISVIIGFAIPGSLLFLRETLNHTVRGRKDLSQLQIPFIGEIPDIFGKKQWWQKKKKLDDEIVISAGCKDFINESFRSVRTKLDYFISDIASPCKIIMLTSFNPGSGKSFISANLSKTMSLKGKKVLVIDMDIRRCSLSKMLKANIRKGLTAYLSGIDDNIENLIISNGFGSEVDVLPVGIIPPNPTELLLSERMSWMFDALRQQYDYIFLDCPPAEIVADASIIKKYADACIFIARVGLMDRRLLKEVDQLYKDNTYQHMCILLNGSLYISSQYGHYKYTDKVVHKLQQNIS